MDTVEKIEEYLESLEEYFFSSVSTVTAGFPDVHEAVNRLWVDISRYGPGLPAFPEVHLPALGDFQIPPPPPPPPPPHSSTWLDKPFDWVTRHPWKISGLVIGVVGTGLLFVGYSRSYTSRRRGLGPSTTKVQTHDRRQVVVVLGGDTLYALPLIVALEKRGYIIIASVSTPEACTVLESKCQGYVRALVLDPSEPATVNVFLRSLTSTLSLRFPTNVAGDPYVAPSAQPYIHSIISLLTLPTNVVSTQAPLEHVSLQKTYLPYLTTTQLTPLRVIQGLLPMLRTGSARSRDKGKKTIIVCLPATETRVGVPFGSIQAMTAASTLRGIEVLRREINLAALTDRTESMKNIRVVVAEVGALKTGDEISTSGVISDQEHSIATIYKEMENWSASEKVSYGPAFAAIARETHPPTTYWESLVTMCKTGAPFGIRRQPTDVSVFVDHLINIVSGGKYAPKLFGFGIGLGRIRNVIWGDRFSIGAGASTYKLASYLPSLLLDRLLNLPAFLISIRNRLLPIQLHVSPSQAPPRAAVPNPSALLPDKQNSQESAQDNNHDDVGSEAETESNVSEAADNSWIRLHHSRE
ncbi:hypothetical protein AMATHDRAFT_53151 [Amanita thiersii Skay4041]|uniref:DUF1776-domain-containing protein n=1 Tax=Amanita thiersii Skay4041 TaxID=703135 RepID=A0A2A9NUN9_9AGAR|nr:hypothetical protein AMATHDRAFT_53151 [Amanita thiersii Skay4041]